MVELVSTDDPVLLSWLMAQLADAEIGAVVFDSHTTALLPGTLGLIQSRVMVGDD
ncbi:putative signal transducing protein, partial [Rhodospirillum rubrum]